MVLINDISELPHLSAKLQVPRKSQHLSLSHYFYYFQRPCTMK